jgi:hypothetical protein
MERRKLLTFLSAYVLQPQQAIANELIRSGDGRGGVEEFLIFQPNLAGGAIRSKGKGFSVSRWTFASLATFMRQDTQQIKTRFSAGLVYARNNLL